MARTKQPQRNRVVRIVNVGKWRIVNNVLKPNEVASKALVATIRKVQQDAMIKLLFSEAAPEPSLMTFNRSILIEAKGPLKALALAHFEESERNLDHQVPLDDPFPSFCAIRDFLHCYPIDLSSLRDDFYLTADKWQLGILFCAFFMVKIDEESELDAFCWYTFHAMRHVTVPALVSHTASLRFALLFELEELDISHGVKTAGFEDLRHMLETTKTTSLVMAYAQLLCSKESLSVALSGDDLHALNFMDPGDGLPEGHAANRMTVWCKRIAAKEPFQEEKTFPFGRDGIKEIRIDLSCIIEDRHPRNESDLNLVITGVLADNLDIKRYNPPKKLVRFKVTAVEDGCCCEYLERGSPFFDTFEADVEQSSYYSLQELIRGVRVVGKKRMAKWTCHHYERCGLLVVVDMLLEIDYSGEPLLGKGMHDHSTL